MINRGSMRFALLCGVAAISVAGSVPVARAEDGELVKNLLGNMGVIPRQKEDIRYRERAPLVVPPKAELRAPSAGAAAANPNWPSDPEIVAARRAAEEARTPRTQTQLYRSSDRNTYLTPAEMERGRVDRGPATDQRDHVRDRAGSLLSIGELWAGRTTENAPVAVTEEPKRKSLTEPPAGFRKQTNKNPGSEFTPKVDQQAYDSNPINWLTSRFTKGSDDD